MKRNVVLSQVNNLYGRNAFLPYSAGIIWSYAQLEQAVQDEYILKEFVFLRESIPDVVRRLGKVDVWGASIYIWNVRYTLALTKAIKEANPDCLTVVGGPHVPIRNEAYIAQHPYLDLLVRYEGEQAFRDILLQRAVGGDFSQVGGVTVCDGPQAERRGFKGPDRPRMLDLDAIPSPYLTGVFDSLMRTTSLDLHASQETHRGCPFSCQFCDWGSNTYAKVKKFGDDRLLAELEWFAINKVDLLYNCDANFAMFERDVELTRQMVKTKEKYGYPKKFRAAYAKNSGERVYIVSKMLNDAGMSKGATLSFQSMDETTLETIKRKNIGTEVYRSLMKRYRAEGIPTYSEIIIGLPGETYTSFAEGLDTLVTAGAHSSVQAYHCEMLPNSEMSTPAYRKEHQIKSVTVPVLFYHGTPTHDPYEEEYELIVSTATLPKVDWLKCSRLSWIIQCFHCLGLTQKIAVFCKAAVGLSYSQFYEGLLTYADDHPATLLGQVTNEATDLFIGITQGKGAGILDLRFGNIVWPTEEGSFLKLVAKLKTTYSELQPYLEKILFPTVSREVFWEVLTYQEAVLIDPWKKAHECHYTLAHNLHEYLEATYNGEKLELTAGHCQYVVDRKVDYKGCLETYAREQVWYQRKGGSNYHVIRRVNLTEEVKCEN